MPHVIVKMYPGTPEEQKYKLAEEITSAIMKIVNKPEGAVSVAIEEVEEKEYKNQDALDFHNKSVHLKQFFTDITPLLAGKPIVEVF